MHLKPGCLLSGKGCTLTPITCTCAEREWAVEDETRNSSKSNVEKRRKVESLRNVEGKKPKETGRRARGQTGRKHREKDQRGKEKNEKKGQVATRKEKEEPQKEEREDKDS